VLNALASAILGPSIFLPLFEYTTETLPQAIFILGACELTFPGFFGSCRVLPSSPDAPDTGIFATSFSILIFVRVRPTRSLPALPARPEGGEDDEEQPSSAAAAAQGEGADGDASTRSRWRMRPLNPFRSTSHGPGEH
jgi:hypothetical protein